MWKITKIIKKSIKSLLILLKMAQAVGQKTSRQNVTSTVLIFSSFCLFDRSHGWKNQNQLKRNALKEERHAHRKRARSELRRERTPELRQ
jgi:hypothetical protein